MSVFILFEVGISFNVKVYMFIINMSSSFLNLDLSKENFSLKYFYKKTHLNSSRVPPSLPLTKHKKKVELDVCKPLEISGSLSPSNLDHLCIFIE